MGEPAEVSAAEAARRLARGELVAFPTETSWGLAADATSEHAVAALLDWKGRSEGQPISVLVEGPERLAELGILVGSEAARLAARFWPGPLTLVLPPISGAAQRLAAGVLGEGGALGVRRSSHPDATALAARVALLGAGPITATSLNRSGEPAAKTRSEARALCEGPGGPVLLEGQECGAGPPSSVVDCTVSPPVVLREAAISRTVLESVLAARSTARVS